MKKDSKEAVKMEEGKPHIIQIKEGEVQAQYRSIGEADDRRDVQ